MRTSPRIAETNRLIEAEHENPKPRLLFIKNPFFIKFRSVLKELLWEHRKCMSAQHEVETIAKRKGYLKNGRKEPWVSFFNMFHVDSLIRFEKIHPEEEIYGIFASEELDGKVKNMNGFHFGTGNQAIIENNIESAFQYEKPDGTLGEALLDGMIYFLNHHCTSRNAVVKSGKNGNAYVYHLQVNRSVKAGEELLINYGPNYFSGRTCWCCGKLHPERDNCV
jgi:hypothetical protein